MIYRNACHLEAGDRVMLMGDVSTYEIVKKMLDITTNVNLYVYTLRETARMPSQKAPKERIVKLLAHDMVLVHV